ncbi:glycosyltransferase [Inquilinus sp. CAU 1745]|uniref:CgeB family protein n=1 Tax=Inquilinus sp. CAU 1745 TaxID=3140369 RepID=UPI00325AE30A
MRFAYFTHSLVSCWNHGNAHFIRGVLRQLLRKGHTVEAFEPEHGWSRANMRAETSADGEAEFRRFFPDLRSISYGDDFDVEAALDRADVVIVHEWTEPRLIAEIGRARRQGGRFWLLFHDTHHRAVSDPQAIGNLNLEDYDGILAFGETLAEVYRDHGWGDRVFVWHEAADITLFKPIADGRAKAGLVWIGNWGDGERSSEIETFLLNPAAAVGVRLDVHGVRYPDHALKALADRGGRPRGWLPNVRAPETFADHLATIHVPRRFYAETLPGIPTIRMFEALACGIPLVSAPWQDSEGLFRPGVDYLVARSGGEMELHLADLISDPDLRREVSANGLETILARHTCGHRAAELVDIVHTLSGSLKTGAA